MAAQYYKINYKSDFVLTINSDAGWAVPFCIKFWTGMPSHGYFAGFDGENYVNCRVGDTPTQLLVMFDDHHMPIGPLRMQIAYHTTIEEFPDRKFDEVTNPTNVTVDIDGTEYQVMLDFTGETGAEIDFSMPSSGVMSVNGKIGYVTLNAEDVGAQPTIEDLATIRSGAAAGATAVQPNEMTAALATKQDTISDLSEIRRNAALGATAVRPSELQQGLATKQNVIEDLSTIRSGAAAGATAVQPSALQEGLATKQDVISDLSTIRSGAAAGATAVQPAALTPIQTALQTIEAVIPSAATSQNQLADKNFVNSSIATNTANFVGTYNSLAELQAVQNPTNNDYGFVIETDAQGNEYYDRYKYVAASQQWLFEYKVESTPFTAAQWAAIQSGITSALVTKLNALPTNAELQQTLDGKANTSDIPTALSQLSQDSTHRVVTDAEKSTWNGKQNAIDDLATIRSGAAAGATAVQPAAMNTALAAKQDTLTFDNTPTANSSNPVKSSGIKTALDAKQSTISTVNVTVDNNTGTPSGSASVSGSTLSLSFQNLKGATGATGATGPQGPQGERGLPGESGVTGDVSGFTVIQTIDPSATYGATDIAGAATVQATNQELTELGGLIIIKSPITPVTVSGMTVNTSGSIVSVSASYFINYYEAVADCDVLINFTRADSYVHDGRVFIAGSSSDIVVGGSVTKITQVAEGQSYSNTLHLTAGQCLGVTNRASDTFSFELVKVINKMIEEVAEDVEQKYNTFKKYPKEGVNLIELENIQANKLVDSNGNFKTYNGWRGVEIEFCSTDVPIFLNLIYSGYYSLIDAAGNVVKVVQTSGRDLYSGYKLPSGVVKGRFSINSDISDSDISAYAYISYGRPLMQDEVNVRVGFDSSYSMNKSERPTDYDGGDICAFEKILCIGDSITDGTFNHNNISGQTFTAREALSYPSNLASITGRTVINLGDSGESPSSWWATHQNDAELTGVDCAIIELGINGSNDVLDTDTKTAFDSIISALKTRNQKIKIFISSIPTGKAYKAQLSSDTYYQKDQWLRTYYNTYYANDNQVFFLDIARYGHLRDKYSSGNNDDYNSGHLSAYGYWRLAKDYANYISYIMRQSDNNFGDIQFIGTDFVYP